MINVRNLKLALPLVLLTTITACAPSIPPTEPLPVIEPVKQSPAVTDPDAAFRTWLEALRREALEAGIRPEVLHEALDGIEPAPAVITPRHKQAEFALSKSEYVKRLASEQRYREGLLQMAQHRDLLQKVEARYGVPGPYLLALWAIESDFGKGGSKHPVIRALVTQAWQSNRQAFFRKQLLAALSILDQEGIPADALRGSWAGAMGHFQFIPTTYRDYAVDFNGDGHRNIWTDVEDALGSAASYLIRAGWKKNTTWGWQIELPAGFDLTVADLTIKKSLAEWRRLGLPPVSGTDDLMASLILPDGPEGPAFLVTDNVRVLMRWNRSIAFALAVGNLAQRFEEAAPAGSGEGATSSP